MINQIQDIPREEFQNDMVLDLITSMVLYREKWKGNRSGEAWNRIVFTIAEHFPEDRAVIHNMFKTKGEPEKKGGGAKVFKSKKRNAQAVQVVVDDCPDCPGTGTKVQIASKLIPRKGTAPARERTGRINPIASLSQEAILDRFESSEAAMKAYCSANDINIGNASKPETLARIIYQHHNPATDEENQG